MLRVGCIILSIWGGLHFIASALSVVASIAMKYAPIIKIVFSENEIASLDTRLFPVTKSLAIMHNTGAAMFGFFVLVTVWFGMFNGHRWAFFTLLLAGVFAQGMWFFADSLVGNKTMIVNLIFSGLLITGLLFSGFGIFKKKSTLCVDN